MENRILQWGYEQAPTLVMPFFQAAVVFSVQWIKMSGRALFDKCTILFRRAPALDLVALLKTQGLPNIASLASRISPKQGFLYLLEEEQVSL